MSDAPQLSPGSFEYIEQKIRSLGSAKRVGDAFEKLCIHMLTTAPEYRGLFTRVWLWREWPDNWGIDKGIDIVAEQKDGRLWAIQAKCVSPSREISKRELDSFLSESNRAEFYYRLIVATTDKLGPNAEDVIRGQHKQVGLVRRGDLVSCQVEVLPRI